MVSSDAFHDLFVLEMTNNHLGSVQRGLEIIRQHARVVRANGVRAAIKLQFRDVDSFVHKDYCRRTDIRYIRRVTETRMSKDDYARLVDEIRELDCIPMATPFDERSVDWCEDFELPLIKVASADATDRQLLERVAAARRPVIVSVGGALEYQIDEMAAFFEDRSIPLAINHCIAAYPHEASECELNQIDYLRDRYHGHVIGYSSHEHDNWVHSLMIAYAKGARTFERHIDINSDGVDVARYSSLPKEVDEWFKAFHLARKYCGGSPHSRVKPLKREIDYLDSYVRGAYAKRDLPAGHVLTLEDVQLAIPLRRGQISCREFGQSEVLVQPCKKGQSITIDMVDCPYADDDDLRAAIHQRGLEEAADSRTAAFKVKNRTSGCEALGVPLKAAG
jgi:N-acetylneuraminate synthase